VHRSPKTNKNLQKNPNEGTRKGWEKCRKKKKEGTLDLLVAKFLAFIFKTQKTKGKEEEGEKKSTRRKG